MAPTAAPDDSPGLISLSDILEPNVKIAIRFKAIGRAPILKQQVYKINSTDRFHSITLFLRRQLAYKEGDELVSWTTF